MQRYILDAELPERCNAGVLKTVVMVLPVYI